MNLIAFTFIFSCATLKKIHDTDVRLAYWVLSFVKSVLLFLGVSLGDYTQPAGDAADVIGSSELASIILYCIYLNTCLE